MKDQINYGALDPQQQRLDVARGQPAPSVAGMDVAVCPACHGKGDGADFGDCAYVACMCGGTGTLSAAPVPPVQDDETFSATSDRYRAELYDEVWQKARDMGYGNVTEALIALERATPQPPASVPPVQGEPVGEVVVTRDEAGQIIAVTRQDQYGRILSVIAESTPQPVPEPVAECTNEDSWNCKYCRKTETCAALKDERNFATPQPPAQVDEREVRRLREGIGALLSAGNCLSNIAYNLAQQEGVPLERYTCELMRMQREQWGKAVAALSAQQGEGERG